MAEKCDIGLIGLGVMGQNLILNMADHGFTVAAYNRTTARVDEFLIGPGYGKTIVGCRSLEEFVSALKKPRVAMLMIKAGVAVRETAGQLAGLMESGDIIVDGGNSFFRDTEQLSEEFAGRGIFYMDAGISGGEEGARSGPSIMPGGSKEAWRRVGPILQTIAAKAGRKNDIPCCEWIGPAGTGHYVKMIHNGIEYGDMQLICEAYSLLKDGLGLDNEQLYDIFKEWNRGELASYLIEITRDIFSVTDTRTGMALVDLILDRAGQKGTGKWTSQLALEHGVPTTLITEAVFARALSAMKENRKRAGKVLRGPAKTFEAFRVSVNVEGFVWQVRKALFASKICSYAQGFFQLQAASAEYGWNLDLGGIAMLWREGCIIRAAFLEDIKRAYDRCPNLENLLLDEYFIEALAASQDDWRRVVSTAVSLGIPLPAMAAALHYYDGYRCERLPHNLLQAQRDYFGSHTYERIDDTGFFHTDWKGLRRNPPEK